MLFNKESLTKIRSRSFDGNFGNRPFANLTFEKFEISYFSKV
ncbi:hypothetical protein L950_0207390 [Sphingobacterium sp. IITKGP-BTPF85]|nr:hypothetical protein L950_0207390 [Sphingobacterium sp. IITKGP-BTPF85]